MNVRKQRGISSGLAGLLCLFMLLIFFHETRGDVVTLKDLIKPQDVEYHFKITFSDKLNEKQIKEEVKKLEKTYGLKAVRRANGKGVEFKLKEKGDAASLAIKIKKECKTVMKAEVNPLLTEIAGQKVEKDKLKVAFKKQVREYQIEFLEKHYKLQRYVREEAKMLSDKSIEFVYEITKIPLLKVYNGIRKVGVVKGVRFVEEGKLKQMPPLGVLSLPGETLPDKRIMKGLDGKYYEFKIIKMNVEGTWGYYEGLVTIILKKGIRGNDIDSFLKEYNIELFGISWFSSGEAHITGRVLSNKTSLEITEILTKDERVKDVYTTDTRVVEARR